MSRRKRAKKQRAIVTFTDGAAGRVTMKIVFKPSIENGPVTSAAARAAMECVKILSERHQK